MNETSWALLVIVLVTNVGWLIYSGSLQSQAMTTMKEMYTYFYNQTRGQASDYSAFTQRLIDTFRKEKETP